MAVFTIFFDFGILFSVLLRCSFFTPIWH